MLIEIGKDIVEAAQKGNKDALRILNYLGMAFRNKKHIIFAEPAILKAVISIESLSLDTKSVFIYILSKYTTIIKPLLNQLQFRAKLMLTGRSEKHPNLILMNLNDFPDFELYEETHLLCENIFDCKFYRQIGLHYLRENNFKDVTLCLYPLQGGGAASCRVYREEVILKHHFCLALMDSDKGYPKCKKEAETTFGKVKKESDTLKPLNCLCERLQYTREIENLIPDTYIKRKYRDKELVKANVDMAYIDIKNGLSAKLLWFSEAVDYYRRLFASVPTIVSSIDKYEKKKNVLKKEDYYHDVNEHFLIKGLGEKVTEAFLDDNPDDKISKMSPTSENQRKDWSRMGMLVAQWCCAPIIVSTL